MNYEYHEVANIFPLLQGDEYEALKKDIQENGLIESIWLHDNLIVDGRNRYRACMDTGVEPRFREWSGVGSLVVFVVSLNLRRRHLTSSQLAIISPDIEGLIAKEIAEEERVRKQKQDNSTSEIFPKSLPRNAAKETASILGTNEHYVRDAKSIQEKAPELVEKIKLGAITIPEAKKEIKKQANESARHAVALLGKDQRLQDLAQIVCADFRDYFLTIPDNSVDLIFTDPPYDKESIHFYGELAFHASRVLKSGGSLVVYAGHYAVPEIASRMSEHLRYWWMLALSHQSGNHRRLEGVKVYVHWKPLLWYVKDTYLGKRAMADMFETDNPNKELHDWAQDVSAASYYIDYLTDPGDLVIDPMCGSGTICLAAIKAGRRTIGIEIDEERANVAKYVLGEEYAFH